MRSREQDMSATGVEDRVAAVRAFNRFYTNVVGLLRAGLLRTPYTLTEARVIFELAQREATELRDLRRTLDIDAGYLSRILDRFDDAGLARRERSSADRRRQVIRLTGKGRRTFAMLDRRSAKQVRDLLSGITGEQQRRVVRAMGAIREVLDEQSRSERVVLRAPRAGELGWVVQCHGALYADEYGWDDSFEGLVARVVADYAEGRDDEREAAWIADIDGEPVGCVFCTKREDKVAQLRLLLVEPSARGMGIGTRLVEECIRFARNAGYERMMLWTNDVLEDARRIYERTGFELGREERHRSFGHDLVGQDWWRTL
jgi:DNA-binding MarR family transcriptional regulator/N-acetylglutamate synthase-like GNAT family acetyltransferase